MQAIPISEEEILKESSTHGSSELSCVLQKYFLHVRSPVAHITLTIPYPRQVELVEGINIMSTVNINRPIVALENIVFIILLCKQVLSVCTKRLENSCVCCVFKCTKKLAGTQKINRIQTKFVSTVYVEFILRFNVRCHSNEKQIIIVRLKFVWDQAILLIGIIIQILHYTFEDHGTDEKDRYKQEIQERQI